MDWRYIPSIKLEGLARNRRAFTIPSDQGVRFLIVDGKGKLTFTATYATQADGEQRFLKDYQEHLGVAVADGCKFCGRVIETTNKRAIFCSRECQKRHGAREQTKRKRAARRTAR